MRRKYESREVYIHAGIIIIIHHFSRTLFHTDRDVRACSHTCKLPIIHPDTEKDIGTERQKRGIRDVPIYGTISDNIAEHRHKQSKKRREKHGSRYVHIHQK